MQGSVVLFISNNWVTFFRHDEVLNDHNVAILAGIVKRSPFISVFNTGKTALLTKVANYVDVTVLTGKMQRSPLIFIGNRGVTLSFAYKVLYNVNVATNRSVMQWCAFGGIFCIRNASISIG